MHRFDTSQYYKLWESKEGRKIMSTILSDPDMLYSNHQFWREKFLVDPAVTPTDDRGNATFRSEMRRMETGTMAHLRAPLGDSVQREAGNAEFYTGSIPDFITDGWLETAKTRLYRERLYSQLGNDRELIQFWVEQVAQPQVDSVNQTLSNMAAQLMSTGKINYKYGLGIKDKIEKADIPSQNFLKAGTKVWTDTTARLLDQIVTICDNVRNMIGVDMQFQLEITRNMWRNNFLNNAQVIEWVRYMRSMNNVLLPSNVTVTTEMANEALASFEGLPKIVIIEEKQKDAVSGIVQGWNDSVAVLRPLGMAGYMRHTNILDEEVYTKFANNAVTFNFAPAVDGLALVMNSVIPNGNLKEWHTDTMFSCVPTLDEFLYHYIIDTSTAN